MIRISPIDDRLGLVLGLLVSVPLGFAIAWVPMRLGLLGWADAVDLAFVLAGAGLTGAGVFAAVGELRERRSGRPSHRSTRMIILAVATALSGVTIAAQATCDLARAGGSVVQGVAPTRETVP